MINFYPIKTSETILENQKISYIFRLSKNPDSLKPVTVFLHGWGSSSLSFSQLFRDQENFLAFDFPHFGKSSDLQKIFTLEDYTRITQKFLEKFLEKNMLTNQKIILVGHSFGGRVIVKLLDIYPENFSPKKVEKIVFIAVPFYREKNVKTKTIEILVKISNILLPKSLQSGIKNFFHRIFRGNDYFDLAENKIMKKTFQNIIQEEIEPYLAKISQYNSFCFWGENDDIIPLWFAKKAKNEKIPELKIFSIPEARHFPWIDAPEIFMKNWKKVFQ